MIADQKLKTGFAGVYLVDNGDINGTQLATGTKPSRFKRKMTKFLLGWKWISIEKLKDY